MSLPFMPFYWGDYWRDTGHLSDAEHVAYLKLISHYWQHESLPDDDARLARIAGRSQQEWQTMRGTLQAFFVDGWKHNRIEKELVKQKAVRQVSVERATKAANARWNAPSMLQASSEQCSTNANQNHNQISKPINNIYIPKFPADGTIAYSHWADKVRATGKNIDPDFVASGFRKWARSKDIQFDDKNIEKIFLGFLKHQRAS